MTKIEQLAMLAKKKDKAKILASEIAQIEEHLATGLCAKPEGTTSLKVGDAKVQIIATVNRTIDQNHIDDVELKMSGEHFNKVFPIKRSVNKTALSVLQQTNPIQYRLAAKAIIEKTGKPRVNVEFV